MAPTPALISAVAAAVLLAGCTSNAPSASSSAAPTTPSQTASPSVPAISVTPSPSLTPDQAAAVEAVDRYRAAIRPIEENPAKFTAAQMKASLKMVAGGKVIDANLSSYLSLKKRGFRYDGETSVVSTRVANESTPSYGTEVVVTRCIDQRKVRVLDRNGNEVSETELGYAVADFNLRQYTVVKRTGTTTFLVYGLAPAKGECGP